MALAWPALGALLIAFHLGLIFYGLVPNLVARPLHLALALPWVLILAAAPEGHVVVATRRRNAHERLGHETGEDAMLPRDLRADLPIGRQTVRVAQHIVEHPVQFELARCVLVIALDHVEAHFPGIADHLQ